ncbi:hypothetical protein ACFC00_29195 [Streptomyces adustus]|uniref:hypothetical protein n=1 Tax=Streptomyces adustus TaxID=1609272 RepID=UPI0035E39D79
MSESDTFLREHKDAILAGLELHQASLNARLLAIGPDTPRAKEMFRVLSEADMKITRAIRDLTAMEWPEA